MRRNEGYTRDIYDNKKIKKIKETFAQFIFYFLFFYFFNTLCININCLNYCFRSITQNLENVAFFKKQQEKDIQTDRQIRYKTEMWRFKKKKEK